jgi:hypothetical protein
VAEQRSLHRGRESTVRVVVHAREVPRIVGSGRRSEEVNSQAARDPWPSRIGESGLVRTKTSCT